MVWWGWQTADGRQTARPTRYPAVQLQTCCVTIALERTFRERFCLYPFLGACICSRQWSGTPDGCVISIVKNGTGCPGSDARTKQHANVCDASKVSWPEFSLECLKRKATKAAASWSAPHPHRHLPAGSPCDRGIGNTAHACVAGLPTPPSAGALRRAAPALMLAPAPSALPMRAEDHQKTGPGDWTRGGGEGGSSTMSRPDARAEEGSHNSSGHC